MSNPTHYIKWLLWCLPAVCMLLFPGCANRLFYHPSPHMAPPPSARGMSYESIYFTAADGTRLSGWWLPAPDPAKGTVVHFHGNAQNMSNHISFADWLPAAGYHLFVFDYRGYGQSDGTPSRKGLVQDGIAALQTAHLHPDFHPPLLVWGQSLGGTVGLRSILEVPEVDAMLVDSTFTGYGDIAAEKLRLFPWYLQPLRLFRPLLITNGPDALDAVQNTTIPLAFLHGKHDPIIPAHHSATLHEHAQTGTPLWIIPQAGHCDAVLRFPEQTRPLILEFFDQQTTQPPQN